MFKNNFLIIKSVNNRGKDYADLNNRRDLTVTEVTGLYELHANCMYSDGSIH